MDIPIQNPQVPDVFSYGFNNNLTKPILAINSQVAYDPIADAQNTGTIPSAGNLTLKTLTIGGFTKMVGPGDDINAAIQEVNRNGGGTVQLIAGTYSLQTSLNMLSNVILSGAGKAVTILDFLNGSNNLNCIGISSNIYKNIGINNLTVQNSTGLSFFSGNGSLSISFTDGFVIENCLVKNSGDHGILINNSQSFVISGCDAQSNANDGIQIDSTARDTLNFTIVNCTASGNSNAGMRLASLTSSGLNINNFTFINSSASSNSGDGFGIDGGGANVNNGSYISCVAISNAASGFNSGANAISNVKFISCYSASNNVGITFRGNNIVASNNTSLSNSVKDFNFLSLSGEGFFTSVGNVFDHGGAFRPSSEYVESDMIMNSGYNVGMSIRTEKKFYMMNNNSSSQLVLGNVITLDKTTTGEDVNTTNINGNPLVFGMALTTVNSGDFGPFLRNGYTSSLFVSNGTASISVGDFLSTYSATYYAKKAIVGETAFAIALSAPTTGTAQINALLITPRLI